jgi:hypothetical protein
MKGGADPHPRLHCDGRELEWRSIVGFKLPNRLAGPAPLPFLTDQASHNFRGVWGRAHLLRHDAARGVISDRPI